IRAEVQTYLDGYTQRYLALAYESSQAEWASNTHIVEGDDTNKKRTEAANEALAQFTGSSENIETCRRLLESKALLDSLQVKQLERILYLAADKPQTVPELVTQRIAAEAAQVEKLFGFEYQLDGAPITPNQIDDLLRTETDVAKRQQVWEASKAVGPTLRDGLVSLQQLRNSTVRALGYSDYFTYQVSDYGMSTAEMIALADQINRELRPLYRELHTWARHELAAAYGQPVPDQLPAHWVPNRWGQSWDSMVQVEGVDLDAQLATKTPEWLVRQAEAFYVSLGFEPLPASFYETSSLYPLPADATYKKNTHASAWHMDLDRDVRSLMSVEPNSEWYET
ncbi:MAG TPA: M2 family metallopeptidase, partial [Roseiflexaceae bacterium]|nr:M2 family metallopeptidase [Roseiflexaceae bacterium]